MVKQAALAIAEDVLAASPLWIEHRAEVLAAEPDLELHLFGSRLAGEPDHGATLMAHVAQGDRDRLKLHFAPVARGRLPASLAAMAALRRLVATTPLPKFDYSIAVGSFVELLAIRFGRYGWEAAGERLARSPRADG